MGWTYSTLSSSVTPKSCTHMFILLVVSFWYQWLHSPFSSVGVSSSVTSLLFFFHSYFTTNEKEVFRSILWDQFTEEKKRSLIPWTSLTKQEFFSPKFARLKAHGKSFWHWGLRRKLRTRIYSTNLCSSCDHIIKVLDYRWWLTFKVKNNRTYRARRDVMWEGSQNIVGTRGV